MKGLIKKIIGQKNAWKLQAKFRSKEQKDIAKKRRDFYLQFLSKGDWYFDVGANFGNRIEPIINDGINIVAVEPQKKCLDYLSVRFKGDIHIVPKGLGSEETELQMFVADSDTVSSFSESWVEAVKETNRYGDNEWKPTTEKLPITTLDKVIEQFAVPKFVKIDVEGFELEVLKGLSYKIPYLSIEYTVPEELNKTMACLEVLHKINGDTMQCNYSIGESMEWHMDWLSYEDMLKHIETEAFINTRFGDIYIKTND